MHHVPNVNGALREVFRVLAPDGRAVFSEPGAGHARQAHAVRAMQDFGVQEADIDAGTFLDQCRAAGFVDVLLEPFAHIVPGHGLTVDQWRHWQASASMSRPRRAVQSLRRALLELIGARKGTELVREALASEALRVLRSAMHDHPIVVASKVPLDRFLHRTKNRTPALQAAIRIEQASATAAAGTRTTIVVDVTNAGTTTWDASDRVRGYVRLGIQLLDSDRRLANREFLRVPLAEDVAPRQSARVAATFAVPATPGSYFLKIDMVSEGVSWFEPHGSTPCVHSLRVT
jgi:hypothetical protein